MILLPHFDIPYGFGLGKIPYDLPFQGPVFFGLLLVFTEHHVLKSQFHRLYTEITRQSKIKVPLRGFNGSRTSTMICEEALVGDMEGEDEAEAPPRSPEEIFRTNWCFSLDPRGLKRVLTVLGVSGVVNGVGNPPDERSPPFSDNWGLKN